MKKVYTKPDLYCESFVLSASIAAACRNSLMHYGTDGCKLDMGEFGYEGETLFNQDFCTIPNTSYEDYCEWTGADKAISLMYS